MYNVIGDIAGQYKTLKALIAKMPEGKVISVGDIIDRGPRSKEVVEYFMNTPNTEVLMGNHEHMMIEFYKSRKDPQYQTEYSSGIWQMNGGSATVVSFDHRVPSKEVFKFLETRPLELKLDIDGKSFYISHAFAPSGRSLEEEESELVRKIWNRNQPIFNSQSADVQICGHNSQFGLRYWNDGNGKKAICIDTSRDKVLTGIHLPTLTLYQQEYIDY